MSDHTPGPWFVVPLPWDDSRCLVSSKSEDPHIGEVICQTDSGAWNDHTDEDVIRWQSNACLIAKAPELLEALEALLEDAFYHGYDRGSCDCGDCGRCKAHALIAELEDE